MKFHIPSFLHYFENQIPDAIGYLHHHYIIYLIADFPIRRDWIQEVTAWAVVQSYEHPLEIHDQIEEQSLIKGLLETHHRTLQQTLHQTQTYIEGIKLLDGVLGEGGRYEYRVDIRTIHHLILDALMSADVSLIKNHLHGEPFCSVRLMQKKLYVGTGKMYSKGRVNEALNTLEALGYLNRNGHFKRYGRTVKEV